MYVTGWKYYKWLHKRMKFELFPQWQRQDDDCFKTKLCDPGKVFMIQVIGVRRLDLKSTTYEQMPVFQQRVVYINYTWTHLPYPVQLNDWAHHSFYWDHFFPSWRLECLLFWNTANTQNTLSFNRGGLLMSTAYKLNFSLKINVINDYWVRLHYMTCCWCLSDAASMQ